MCARALIELKLERELDVVGTGPVLVGSGVPVLMVMVAFQIDWLNLLRRTCRINSTIALVLVAFQINCIDLALLDPVKVMSNNILDRGLVDLHVAGHRGPDTQGERVHLAVRVRQIARAGEELLGVGLVGKMA